MSDPRGRGSRRWTILLALLAIVVVGGVALRATGFELGGDERADRTERSEPTDGDDASAQDDEVTEPTEPTDQPPPPDTSTAISGDLVIEVSQVTAADGQPADVVRSLGPVLLDAQSTLSYATTRLGEPEASGTSEDEPDVCMATWPAYELRAWFYFGHPPSPEASCSRGPLVLAIARGAQWRVEPYGIAIGDEAATLDQSLPGASSVELPPALAGLVEAQDAYVLATGSYAGERSPVLYATLVDDRVDAFAFVSNAD